MRYLICFVIFALCFNAHALETGEKSWKLIENRKNILIFTDNAKDPFLRTYKAVTEVNIPFEDAVRILQDEAGFKNWITGCFISDVLHEKVPAGGSKTRTVHIALEFTWPTKSRDFVADTNLVADTKGGTFSMEMSSKDQKDVLPPNATIRMNSFFGKFEGEYAGYEKTRIAFFCHLDPGGNSGNSETGYIAEKICRNIMEGLSALPLRMKQLKKP
jgi:hypothetical protein